MLKGGADGTGKWNREWGSEEDGSGTLKIYDI